MTIRPTHLTAIHDPRMPHRDAQLMHQHVLNLCEGHPDTPRILWALPDPALLVIQSPEVVVTRHLPHARVTGSCRVDYPTGERVAWALIGCPIKKSPAYAQSFGGHRDRQWLRVSSIGGMRGIEHGRIEWEETYYPEICSPEAGPRRMHP